MISVASTPRIFDFTEPTNIRKRFIGLSGIVAAYFDVEILPGQLFLFFNRRRDCVKVLAGDRDGLAIWYKPMGSGTFETSPLQREGISLEIDHVKLSRLLSDIDTDIRERLQFIPYTMLAHGLRYPERACGKSKETVTVATCRFTLWLWRDGSNVSGKVLRSLAAVPDGRRLRTRRGGDPTQHAGRVTGRGGRSTLSRSALSRSAFNRSSGLTTTGANRLSTWV